MARKKREDLKKYFTKGIVPKQQDFADLVDSCVNIDDDGCMGEEGFAVFTKEGKEGSVLEIYNKNPKSGDASIAWSLFLDSKLDLIIKCNGKDEFVRFSKETNLITINAPIKLHNVLFPIKTKDCINSSVTSLKLYPKKPLELIIGCQNGVERLYYIILQHETLFALCYCTYKSNKWFLWNQELHPSISIYENGKSTIEMHNYSSDQVFDITVTIVQMY